MDFWSSLRSLFWPAGLHPAVQLIYAIMMFSGVLSLGSMGDDALKTGAILTSMVTGYRAVLMSVFGLFGATPSTLTLDLVFLGLLTFGAANIGYYRATGGYYFVEFGKTILSIILFIPILICEAVWDVNRHRRPNRLAGRFMVATRGIVKNYSTDVVTKRLLKQSELMVKEDPLSAWVFMISFGLVSLIGLLAVIDKMGGLQAIGYDFGESWFSPAARAPEGWFLTYFMAWALFFFSGGLFAVRWVVGTAAAFSVFYALASVVAWLAH